MLIGHNDGFLRDKNMKVTAMYNHFGPNCNQRMPRYVIDPPHSRNSRHKPVNYIFMNSCTQVYFVGFDWDMHMWSRVKLTSSIKMHILVLTHTQCIILILTGDVEKW